MNTSAFPLLCIFAIALTGCTGSGSASGPSVIGKLENRTGIICPEGLTNPKFKWSQIGDSYTEYYQLTCERAVAEVVIQKLELTPTNFYDSRSPNAASWWIDPKGKTMGREKFSNVTHGSRLKAWFDEPTKSLSIVASLWD